MLITERNEKLKFVAIELERTQKTLCLFNNRTNSLDHLITSDKSFGDHSDVGFKGESSGVTPTFQEYLSIVIV